MSENTIAAGPPQSFHELMQTDEDLKLEAAPTFEGLKELSVAAQKNKRECGVLVIRIGQRSLFNPEFKFLTLYRRGEAQSVRRKLEVPIHLHREKTTSVALHSHPVWDEGVKSQNGFSFNSFPGLNDLDRPELLVGGKLNTFSTEGMVFSLGTQSVPKEIRQIEKRKWGFRRYQEEQPVDPYWVVQNTGSPDLRSSNLYIQMEKGERFQGEVKAANFNYPYYGIRRHFLFVSWSRLQQEGKRSGVTMQDVLFGNGLDKLLQGIHTPIPHQTNLHTAIEQNIK